MDEYEFRDQEGDLLSVTSLAGSLFISVGRDSVDNNECAELRFEEVQELQQSLVEWMKREVNER